MSHLGTALLPLQPNIGDVLSGLKNDDDHTRCRYAQPPLFGVQLIPYRNREAAERSIEEYIRREEELPVESVKDKLQHSMGVMSAPSGFGKTRLLLELPHLFRHHTHWKWIYMTYNSSCNQSTDEVCFPSERMFAWRLLYFYFSPNDSWENFLKGINGSVIEKLDLSVALKYISDDMKRLSPELVGQRVVLILLIDEFQLLCKDDRFASVLQGIANVMCTPRDDFLCVPIFTGLLSIPFTVVAKYSSMWPYTIALPPLGFDDAEDILISASGNRSIMQNPIVRQLVWIFSSLPACLLKLLQEYQRNSNWIQSYKNVRVARFDGFVTRFLSDNPSAIYLFKLVALAITKIPKATSSCSPDFLENSGLCWSEADGVIGAPYAILEPMTVNWHANVSRDIPLDNFQKAFEESSKNTVIEFGSTDVDSWVRLERVFCAYTAFRINCFGLLGFPSLPLSQLLGGAYFPVELSRRVEIKITPTHVSKLLTVVDPSILSLDFGRSLYFRTCADQDVIDAFTFFPGSYIDDYFPVVFDIFLFQQMKYRPKGGMVPQTYRDAGDWCRNFITRYTSSTNRQAGFVFGVIDPLKSISPQLKDQLNSLTNAEQREFYFAIGREEMRYFGMFQNHPLFIPRVYINDPALQSNHLALILPFTYPEIRAKKIIDHRPLQGYHSWEEVLENAKLDNECGSELNANQMPIGIKFTPFL